MVDALPELPTLLQAGSVLGLLVWLYVRLLMHHRQDRTEARQHVAEIRAAHAAELAAVRAQLAERDRQLDAERRRRWKAEDAAARYRRQLGLPPTIGRGVDGDR